MRSVAAVWMEAAAADIEARALLRDTFAVSQLPVSIFLAGQFQFSRRVLSCIETV